MQTDITIRVLKKILFIGVAISGDRNVIKKETENFLIIKTLQ